MQVLDEERYRWVLLEHEGQLYLDVYCSHSCVDYWFLIALNADETANCEKEGRNYINKIAYDVHYSAPLVQNSNSPYKIRALDPIYRHLATEAFNASARP
jgi:hypothetical protein